MKKIIFKYLPIVAAIALLASCNMNFGGGSKSFDEALIYGKWQNGQEYWVYDAIGGTGHTWDEADDVTETEAQQFVWEIDGEELHITHIGEMGEQIPKDYTLTELTSTTLKYKDMYGKTFSFTKCE